MHQKSYQILILVYRRTWLPNTNHWQLVCVCCTSVLLIQSQFLFFIFLAYRKEMQEVKINSSWSVNFVLSVHHFSISPQQTHSASAHRRLRSWQVFVTNNGLVVRGLGEEVKTDTQTFLVSISHWQLVSAMLEGALPSLGTLFILIILISTLLLQHIWLEELLMADTHLSILLRLPANYKMRTFGKAIRISSGCFCVLTDERGLSLPAPALFTPCSRSWAWSLASTIRWAFAL